MIASVCGTSAGLVLLSHVRCFASSLVCCSFLKSFCVVSAALLKPLSLYFQETVQCL